MYTILYIDNGAVTGTAVLPGIFGPYQFELQQFMTDVPIIQAQADEASGDQTPDSVNCLGCSVIVYLINQRSSYQSLW